MIWSWSRWVSKGRVPYIVPTDENWILAAEVEQNGDFTHLLEPFSEMLCTKNLERKLCVELLSL